MPVPNPKGVPFGEGPLLGALKICEEIAANLPILECDPDLMVKTAVMDKTVQTSVANDGPGIPAEKLGELFEKGVVFYFTLPL